MSKFGDLMQGFILGNPKRADWFVSNQAENFWENQGKKKALSVYNNAIKNVTAYKKFLKSNGANLQKAEDLEDFKKIPYTDKKNYIDTYSLTELMPTDSFLDAVT